MSSLSPARRRARSRIALLSKHHAAPEEIEEARRDYRAAVLEQHIEELGPGLTAEQQIELAGKLAPQVLEHIKAVVDQAPPITAEQAAVIGPILRSAP